MFLRLAHSLLAAFSFVIGFMSMLSAIRSWAAWDIDFETRYMVISSLAFGGATVSAWILLAELISCLPVPRCSCHEPTLAKPCSRSEGLHE